MNHPIGQYVLSNIVFARLGCIGSWRDMYQHAGPKDATYSPGSPISEATIHGQRRFFRSSLISGSYLARADWRKTPVTSEHFGTVRGS